MKLLVLSLMIFAVACKGEFSVTGDPDVLGTPDDTEKPSGIERDPTLDPDIPDDESCRFITPGESPLRRLTGDEMNNVYQDLFPGFTIPAQSFSEDEIVGSFEANVVQPVDLVLAEQYQQGAENVALIVSADPAALCNGDCTTWVLDFAYRAFRRPLDNDERTRLATLFAKNLDDFDEQMALQLAVEAVLQSPNVIYRVELGASEDDVAELTDYELATRLAFFLTGSTPDDALLAAAEAGELTDKDKLEEQTRRILELPTTRVRINDVFIKWFGLQDVHLIETPRFTEEQKQLMKTETEMFIDHVLWEDDATLDTLFTADYAFVSAENGYLYDVEVNDGIERVDLPAHRRGILSHPSFLAEHGKGSAIVHRGKFIKDALMCTSTNDPPDELEMLPTFAEESARSKAEKRINATEEGCATCHLVIDNLGLVFDQYNANGVFIGADEFGNPLTSTGAILGTNEEGIDGPVEGIPDLAAKLIESVKVRDCVTRQFLTYALARTTGADDQCSLLTMQLALDNSDGSLTEMLVSVIKTDSFRYRLTEGAE